MDETLYITGAGVSAKSGIPTFRGVDGFWTIGSKNYTPQEMATRNMYENCPDQFLLWYFKRFVKYKDILPNNVHLWLKNKKLITQNIDGLDGKAGNKSYIPIHGRLDKVTLYHTQGTNTEIINAPWNEIKNACRDLNNNSKLINVLLDYFRISKIKKIPEINISLKPFVLLFDEFYTNIYRYDEAESWMKKAKEITFLGTSFRVNITNIALNIAFKNNAKVNIVDPLPPKIRYLNLKYYKMTAEQYISLK